ncbi:GNAT family N-acetyltransferase [Hydrogenoanaerobacterium sp.]|uniref:GNAT family N-acetyltransferase n=1 Tax=Hydrogenoanaerobacterium sp. TaxID=2953763 RepID=UPI00289DFEC0|nr:GNAT family N-acetyltransferase [Hydrogenoanaerobacterium sp.]
MLIEKIDADKRECALLLIEKTFMQYEAPDYSSEGVNSFKKILDDKGFIDGLEMLGAYIDSKLVGVIATKNSENHISLFFVDGNYHKQGIGKALFKQMLQSSAKNIITVNSSPYAVAVYACLGFVADCEEKLTDGIRYTPMTYIK